MPVPIRNGPAPGAAPRAPTPRITSPAMAFSRLSQLTTQEKAKLLVMNYGDGRGAPWSGSVIVNQTHLTAAGTRQLAQANQTPQSVLKLLQG